LAIPFELPPDLLAFGKISRIISGFTEASRTFKSILTIKMHKKLKP
jgi:hypothetical protein